MALDAECDTLGAGGPDDVVGDSLVLLYETGVRVLHLTEAER